MLRLDEQTRSVAMPEDIRSILKTDEVVDITTTGRKSGDARRIEIRLRQKRAL